MNSIKIPPGRDPKHRKNTTMAKPEILLDGFVGRNSKMQTLKNGNDMFSFSISIQDEIKENGVPVKKTTYYNVTAFGGLATYLNGAIERGANYVHVRGTYSPREYVDKEGKTKIAHDVIADRAKPHTVETRASDGNPQERQENSQPKQGNGGFNQSRMRY